MKNDTGPWILMALNKHLNNQSIIRGKKQTKTFRHHCSSVQSAIKIVMDNISDFHQMTKLLRDIGSHHFFYDAYEPHLELMHEGFLHALEQHPDPVDEDLKNGWNQIWDILKLHIGEGIAIQRQNYMTECVTKAEITGVAGQWEKIKDYGIKEAGEAVTKEAIIVSQHTHTHHEPQIWKCFLETFQKAFVSSLFFCWKKQRQKVAKNESFKISKTNI